MTSPSPGDVGRARARLVLGAIVVLALGLRLAHLHAIADTAFPRIPLVFDGSDMRGLWAWAEQIRAGDLLGRHTYHPPTDWMEGAAIQEGWRQWMPGPTFHWAPLYPYWLAVVQALVHGSALAVVGVQLVLGGLQPLVFYALARRLFDRRAGLLAAGLAALYGPFVMEASVISRDWATPILEPLALLGLLRARESDRPRDWALAGALLGVALLAKETIVIFLPLAALWVVWPWRAVPRRAARALGWLAVGGLLCVAPLVARNAAVGAPLLALSDRAVQAIVDGNAADSQPVGYRMNVAAARDVLRRSDGTLLSVAVETLKTYQGDYGEFLRHLVLKLRGLVDPYEVPNNTSFYYGLEVSPVLRAMLRYGLVLPMGLVGLVWAAPWAGAHRLTVLYMLSVLAGQLVGVVLARYRLTLVAMLVLYGAGALVGAVDALRGRRTARVLAMVGLGLLVAALQQAVLPLTRPEDYARPQEYVLAARIYAQEGRMDRAAGELDLLRRRTERQVADLPAAEAQAIARFEGDVRVRWAAGLLGTGRRAEAADELHRAEQAYGRVSQGDLREAVRNLGVLFLALGDRTRATTYLEMFLGLEPQGPRAEEARRLLARPPG